MYHRWLDRWDERRARVGDGLKERSDFALDAELAFPGARKVASLSEFCILADRAAEDPTFFSEPTCSKLDFEWKDEWISFQSGVLTDTVENNVVWAKVTESRSFNQALVVFHHWNARSRNGHIANFFSRRGTTVVEIAMPYHFERRRLGSLYADRMLSPNLGRTVQAMRQAVLDGRKLIRILSSRGYGKISVLGMSLGSWVAGLIAAHDPGVRGAALILTAGSLADMVWTGRATRHIRTSLEDEVELSELRRAWGPLNLENYVDKLARPDLDLQVVLGMRDTVVMPELSMQLMSRLNEAGAEPGILELNCGHYSLSLPPYILRAAFSVSQLLTRNR